MDNERVVAIRAALDAATQGEWKWRRVSDDVDNCTMDDAIMASDGLLNALAVYDGEGDR